MKKFLFLLFLSTCFVSVDAWAVTDITPVGENNPAQGAGNMGTRPKNGTDNASDGAGDGSDVFAEILQKLKEEAGGATGRAKAKEVAEQINNTLGQPSSDTTEKKNKSRTDLGDDDDVLQPKDYDNAKKDEAVYNSVK